MRVLNSLYFEETIQQVFKGGAGCLATQAGGSYMEEEVPVNDLSFPSSILCLSRALSVVGHCDRIFSNSLPILC